MTNNTDSPTEVEIGSYLTAYLYRVPEKNHDVITQNLKKFIPWFEKNGVRLEYYNLAGRETQEVVDSSNAAGMEGMESIAKTLAAEDEDIWMELQYFRDHSHCKEVYAKMMTDKSLEPLLNEFFGLNYTRKGPYHRWIQSPQALAISVISISTTKSMRRKFSLAHFLLFISMTLTAVNYSTTSNATVQAHNFHSHLHHP